MWHRSWALLLLLLRIATLRATALPTTPASDYYYALTPSAYIAKACETAKSEQRASLQHAPSAPWYGAFSLRTRRWPKPTAGSSASKASALRRAVVASRRYLKRSWAWPAWARRRASRLHAASAGAKIGGHGVVGLSAVQAALLDKVTRELELDEGTTGVLSRAKACGLLLSHAHLARFFATADWKEAWPDGCTIRQAVHNTVAWRERRRVWALVTSAAERQRLLRVLGPFGMCITDPALDAEGVARATVRMADVQHVPTPLLSLIPDLMLLTMERAEMASLRAGVECGRVLLVIDCAGCSLGLLKKYVTNASPVFAELAAHYPDRLAGAKVVNSSRTVAFVYKALVAPFLTEQTRAKIEFVETGAPPAPCARAASRALIVDAAAGEGGCAGGGAGSSPVGFVNDFDPAAYLARDL